LEEYEETGESDLTLQGTTYFLSRRTLTRFGFSIVSPHPLQTLLLYINFLPLLMATSLAHRKWQWPSIRNTLSFEAKTSEIVKNKAYIQRLVKRLG
jgi:hypothetical protein